MAAILSILVLAAIALTIGAGFLWRRGEHARQAALMLLLAVIMAINVAIWTLPGNNAPAPLGQELR